MKKKLTPKYWVAKHINSNDVVIMTATKNYSDTFDKCVALHGIDRMDEFNIILVEIKEVKCPI